MNDTLINNETTTAAMPFPSTVNTPCPNENVQVLSREIVDTSHDLNNLFASAGNVHKFVRTHYVDTKTGTYGIESLIKSILKSNGALFPVGIESTEYRTIAIKSAMFVAEIIKEVQATFGIERYPAQTIHNYLSTFAKTKFGKIKLTNNEDNLRKCCKPRCKYYVIE